MQSHQMFLIDIDLNVSIVDTGTDDGDRQEKTPTTHLSSNVSLDLNQVPFSEDDDTHVDIESQAQVETYPNAGISLFLNYFILLSYSLFFTFSFTIN